MQRIGVPRRRDQAIIIVAPADAEVRVVRDSESPEVVAFGSADEFDRWADRHRSGDTIAADVAAALRHVRCARESLPETLRDAIDALCNCATVPDLPGLAKTATSRRSFYRLWNASVRETPSAFLRRVRTHHATRLLAAGMSRKEAALAAGFSSADQMRRHVGKIKLR